MGDPAGHQDGLRCYATRIVSSNARVVCFEYKTNVFDTVAGRCYRSSHAHQNMLMLAKWEGIESLELSRFFVPEASATLAGGLFAFRPVTGLRQVTGRGGQK